MCKIKCKRPYIVDPGNIGRYTGKHRGLLVIVAAKTGAKTYNALNFPGTISSLAVQWATRVTLQENYVFDNI